VTTAATVMLVVTLPVRAAAIVVVAAPASTPPLLDPLLELPELPEELLCAPELLAPLELPEPLEPPEDEPESDGFDDELQANERAEAIDATAREANKTREEDFVRARR
jgi:hypothetical protein